MQHRYLIGVYYTALDTFSYQLQAVTAPESLWGANGRPKENRRGAQHLYNLTNDYNGPQAKKVRHPDLDGAGTATDVDEEQNTNLSTGLWIESSYVMWYDNFQTIPCWSSA